MGVFLTKKNLLGSYQNCDENFLPNTSTISIKHVWHFLHVLHTHTHQ